MTAGGWDPDIYGRFREARARPARDLRALVRRQRGMRVVDLGCGTGEVTRALHRHLGAAATLGIDRSPAMLARAPAGERGLSFAELAIEDFLARGGFFGFRRAEIDLLFSNAALHWLPNHEALLEELSGLLAPGGQIAVQVPAMHEGSAFRAAAATASASPHRERLRGYVSRYGTLAPEAYARALVRLGFVEQRVRLEVYLHTLPGPEAVCHWAAGSTLAPYRARLAPAHFDAFFADFRAELLSRLPDEQPFHYPFKRILFWGALAGPPPGSAP